MERLAQIRGLRDVSLAALDTAYIRALEGAHATGRTAADVASEKQTLRDLPPGAETALAAGDDTDDTDGMAAYLPGALG